MKEEKFEHESYGMIRVSKYSGKSQFFGSDIEHNNGITLTIHKAEKKRALSNNWYYAGEEIIQIRMSNTQWVDAITCGMNTQGVPCTLERLQGERIPQTDHVKDKKERFTSELKEMHQENRNSIDEIIELMMDGNIGKRKKEELIKRLKSVKHRMGSNEEFIAESFQEEMEHIVTEAKGNISGYIDNKIHTYGLEALKNEANVSIESTKEDLTRQCVEKYIKEKGYTWNYEDIMKLNKEYEQGVYIPWTAKDVIIACL